MLSAPSRTGWRKERDVPRAVHKVALKPTRATAVMHKLATQTPTEILDSQRRGKGKQGSEVNGQDIRLAKEARQRDKRAVLNSCRRFTAKLEVRKTTINRIAKDELKHKTLKKVERTFSSEQQNARRVASREDLLRKIESGYVNPETITLTDETRVETSRNFRNIRNDQLYFSQEAKAVDGEQHLRHQKMRRSRGQMLSVASSAASGGPVIGPRFFGPGQKVLADDSKPRHRKAAAL